jgi:protein phosphatase
LQDKGLSPALTRRFNNVVTRTLNTDGQRVDVDIFHLSLLPGDRILLCSDGLSDLIADEAIMGIVNLSASAKEACEQLVQAALDNGGRDNVTVVLARV